MSKYFCYQGNDSDCGFASLKMLLATLNKNKSFLYMQKPSKRSNYSFSDLIDIAREHGLNLVAYDDPSKDIFALSIPCLALLDNNHLILIRKLTAAAILVSDPYCGERKIKKTIFITQWSGKSLEVKSFKKDNYRKTQIIILSLKIHILSYIISAVGVASLLIGLFFVKANSLILIPLILLAVFALCELVDKWYLIKIFNYFDNKYIPLFFETIDDDLKGQYKDYISFKQKYLSFGRKFITAFVISTVIIATLIINNPYNGIVVLILLVATIICHFVFKEKDRKTLQDLSKQETELIKKENENLLRDIKQISKDSGNQALKISLRKCVMTFFVIILSYLLMLASHQASVNFLLFHFGLYYVLYVNFETLVESDFAYSEYKKLKARFIDKCNL